MWCGSDDGLIHVSRDAGKSWSNVTPPDMPEWLQINSIEAHPFEKAGLFVAATGYKLDDFKPYLYKTTDYGKSWTKITDGIDPLHFTRVIRADPMRRGLLYAGTERGVYVSFDDGANWRTLQRNLPIVPVTDMTIPADHSDLVVATQGRSFWVLDDLHHLRQVVADPGLALYQPEPVYRLGGGGRRFRGRRGGGVRTTGQNPPGGVVVRFRVPAGNEAEVSLDFRDSSGDVLRHLSTKGKGRSKIEVEEGMNLYEWDMRLKSAERFDGMVMWSGYMSGPLAVPGRYQVVLTIGDEERVQDFEIRKDPRSESTVADLQAQYDFLLQVRDKLTESHRGISRIRDIRSQVGTVESRAKGMDDVSDLMEIGGGIKKRVTAIEEALYQTKNKSSQDPLNFPIRLTNKLAAVAGTVARGDYRPTDNAVAVKDMLIEKIEGAARGAPQHRGRPTEGLQQDGGREGRAVRGAQEAQGRRQRQVTR